MDWTLAIEKNRAALKRIVAALVAMAGGPSAPQAAAPPATPPEPAAQNLPPLPRHLRLAVLRLLRPAEAAARRLIVIAARGIVVTPPQPRPSKPSLETLHAGLRSLGIAVVGSTHISTVKRRPRRTRTRVSFPLVERLRLPRLERHVPARCAPRVLSLFDVTRQPAKPAVRTASSSTRIGHRLDALGRALDDLPAHALRLARWTARQRLARRQGRAGRWSPLTPGPAPGLPKSRNLRQPHEAHNILRDLHGLARWALEMPDTS